MKKAGKMKEIGDDAHHLFPQNFREQFTLLGIDIDDESYGVWMKYQHHRKYAYAYNQRWDKALSSGLVTADNAMDFARQFMLDVYEKVI